MCKAPGAPDKDYSRYDLVVAVPIYRKISHCQTRIRWGNTAYIIEAINPVLWQHLTFLAHLIVDYAQFKVRLGVSADSAFFRSVFAVYDMPAIAANPDGFLLFGKNRAAFYVVQQF